jgi:flagellar motor switch protein FliN/FliY
MSEKEEEVAEAEGTELEEAIDAATEAVAVQANELQELSGSAGAAGEMELGNLLDVPVRVTVEVGHTRMTLGELVRLGPGSLVTLDRETHEPADVLVNGKVVARGEIVTVDQHYGVRITRVESLAQTPGAGDAAA